ncbi:MAG: SAM-dependent methyltransferase [Chloroflexota bacterium]|nr:SAM-dependent methyltransferase [Chloroflexota bacterium]
MNSPARSLIGQTIVDDGPISFETFMEIALYSEVGYYRNEDVFGIAGDYYTSPHIHPIFASICALQVEKMWKAMDQPAPFFIMEQGAGDATLAKDVLEAISILNQDLYSSLTYICVDRRKIEIDDNSHIEIVQSNQLEPFHRTGVFISNELIDSFPVKMIEIRDRKIFEIYVGINSRGSFEEILVPIAIDDYMDFLPSKIEQLNGYRGPLNTKMDDWYSNISDALNCGFVITIDYGFDREVFFSMEKSHRLLQTYYKHVDGSNPFQRIGSQDITAHVDFDTLKQSGHKYGFKECGYFSQAEWLNSMGLDKLLCKMRADGLENRNTINLISALNDISGLGGFKVLIQGKNVEHFDVRDLNSDVFWPPGLEFPQVKNVHMSNARKTETWETNFF